MPHADAEVRKAYKTLYRANNREALLVKQQEFRAGLRTQALERYGTECKNCGFSDTRALQIDHINNDGGKERRGLGGQNFSGWRFYHWLKQQGWPDGYQTLCANCNMIKHVEFKVH